ncbi:MULTISPECIES: hypothetical protein [Streptomyces]|uniref:hypothetical protein n=1 Tax=Streptomyces TaxID=1883 RepID=UPI000D1AD467|nr:hypothetical protein [Streptomyces sp. P3]AVV41800.1 hypothetical protein C6376_10455 [Streptomyces sp. P3]
MQGDATFQPLFDTALEIDDAGLLALQRGGETVIDDRDLALFQHRNRIALAHGPVSPLGALPDDLGADHFDIPLLCVVHPSQGCHFRSTRLIVDLKATPGALVRDMAPRDVRGESPVELTTTVSTGMTFEVIAGAGGEARRERTATRTVYHPQILASGRGFARAFWDFRSTPGEHLHSERELRLLVSAPPGAQLLVRFNLLAQVALEGSGRIIPLLRKRHEIDQTHRLA